jgi:hypothetical protein
MAMVGRGKEEEAAARDARQRRMRASRGRGERERLGDIGLGRGWARTERRGRGDCVDDHCGCGEVRKEEGKRERGAREGRRFKGWCPFHFHLFFSCFEQY